MGRLTARSTRSANELGVADAELTVPARLRRRLSRSWLSQRGQRLPWRALLDLVVQAAIMIGLIEVYRLGRYLVSDNVTDAMAHAASVWHVERLLHLPSEAHIQRWALAWLPWVHMANRYYVYVHFPLTGIFLAWMWLRHRDGWPRVRMAMIVSTGLALAIQILYPLAPPRLDPGAHMTDTMSVYGPDAYHDGVGHGFANQLAAMPSLHVGWSVLVAWGVVHYGRGRWRWLAVAHPVITVSVVTLTANHYWLDSIVGASLVVLAIAIGAFREGVGRSTGTFGRPEGPTPAGGPVPVGQSPFAASAVVRAWPADPLALRIR